MQAVRSGCSIQAGLMGRALQARRIDDPTLNAGWRGDRAHAAAQCSRACSRHWVPAERDDSAVLTDRGFARMGIDQAFWLSLNLPTSAGSGTSTITPRTGEQRRFAVHPCGPMCMRARSRWPVTELVSIGASSASASSRSSTGVQPFFTRYLGPRTACAGFTSSTWPTDQPGESVRSAREMLFHARL